MSCAACGGEIYKGENRYQWDHDTCDICEECFLEKIRRIPPELLADLIGLRVLRPNEY